MALALAKLPSDSVFARACACAHESSDTWRGSWTGGSVLPAGRPENVVSACTGSEEESVEQSRGYRYTHWEKGPLRKRPAEGGSVLGLQGAFTRCDDSDREGPSLQLPDSRFPFVCFKTCRRYRPIHESVSPPPAPPKSSLDGFYYTRSSFLST